MTTTPMTGPTASHLLRRSSDRAVAGVAAGVADFSGAPVWVARVLFVLATLMGGWGVPLYLVLWLIVPERGSDRGVLDRWLHRS